MSAKYCILYRNHSFVLENKLNEEFLYEMKPWNEMVNTRR